MVQNTWLWAYNTGSRSAQALAEAMSIRRLRHENSSFIGRPTRNIINWGSSSLPGRVLECRIFNNPVSVLDAADKLRTLRRLDESSTVDNRFIPRYTQSYEQAIAWIESGYQVVCRTVLNGHSGQGIVIAIERSDVVQAPLYTMYYKKADEYRVHVVGSSVIDIQRKALFEECLKLFASSKA